MGMTPVPMLSNIETHTGGRLKEGIVSPWICIRMMNLRDFISINILCGPTAGKNNHPQFLLP